MKEPIFETENDKERELKAMEKFASIGKLTFKKLDQFNIDFEIFNKRNELIAYAEVKGRKMDIFEGDYFIVALRKIAKLINKKEPVLIWACNDGIVSARVKDLEGYIKWGGRKNERENAINDQELMVYYPRQENLKYAYFHSNEFYSII
jgi:hypothetical protein